MISKPQAEDRELMHYAAIQTNLSMKEIPDLAPPLIPEVYKWLSENGISAAGPPFFRYLTMDSSGRLDMQVGVPVMDKIKGTGRIQSGSFPAGKYITTLYTGDYAQLKKAHMELDEWMKRNNFKAKHEINEKGQEWDLRTESYVTDPQIVKDPKDWKTEIWMMIE